MKKITLLLLCFFVILNTFSQENLSISVKKIEFDSKFSDQEKSKFNSYVRIFEQQIYKSIDSLSKNQNHTFEGYKELERGIDIIPKIISSKNEKILFYLDIVFLDTYNNKKIETFTMSIFNNVDKVIKDINVTLNHNICTIYLLYLPQLDNKIKNIENNSKHNLNIYLKDNGKNSEKQYNIFKNIFKYIQFNKKNFNFIFEKRNLKNYKNIIEFSYNFDKVEDNYILKIRFKGKNIILKYPGGELIETTFKLNKKRFDAGDYSEFGYLVMPCISSFIIMNK